MSFKSIRFSGQPCDEMREIFWLVSLLKSKIICVWLLDFCILECEWVNIHWTQAIKVRRQDETISRCLAGNTYDWDLNPGLFISPNVIIVIHIHLHFLKEVLSGGIYNWMTWNPACFFFPPLPKSNALPVPFKVSHRGSTGFMPSESRFSSPCSDSDAR